MEHRALLVLRDHRDPSCCRGRLLPSDLRRPGTFEISAASNIPTSPLSSSAVPGSGSRLALVRLKQDLASLLTICSRVSTLNYLIYR